MTLYIKTIMRKYSIFCFLLVGLSLVAQQKNDTIKEAVYYFSLDSTGHLNGDGADFIEKKITESQFFLIGEQHNIHAIETFVSALIPLFNENSYNHYITEIGPVAAAKLTQQNDNLIPLKSYYSNYSSQTNLPPFGFFSTKEEENTLQQLKKYKINLCGIDFENYGSYLSLIDELYQNSDKGKISKNLYHKVYSFVESEYKKGKDNFNPGLMNKLLQSNELKEFLLLAKNETNTPVISQFELSLQINHQLTLGFWQRRVDNMKNNFIQYYHTQSAKENPVKAFIKLGAVHTARGTSFSGNLEVGNLIYELANINQSKSYSIITFPRYILNEKTGETQDLMEEDEKEFLKYAFPDRWTIVDLDKLKELSIQYNVQLNQNLVSYIQKYNAIVIPPVTKYSEKIF